MDKLIDLESVRSMISSVIKENSLSEEEIAECGAACGCGSCATTSADLGVEVQYLGDKKKKEKKEFLDFGTTEVNGNNATVDSGNIEENQEAKKEFLDANATAGDISVLSAGNLLGSKDKEESSLEEDKIKEMARGVLTPQEIAKREYATEYPNSGISTSDQFLRKVINNPEAEGHEKYINRFAYLIKHSPDSVFSNIADNIELDNDENADNNILAKTYADAILNHRKSMAKTSYDSKGTINAYQRNILKRGPYHKPGRDTIIQQVSTGKIISDKYNEVDPTQSNKVLSTFFKSNDWNSLNDDQKIKEINIIKDEADLDEIGFNIVVKEEQNILDRLLGDE